MLPARLLQQVDGGIMVPNLFCCTEYTRMTRWCLHGQIASTTPATVSDSVIEYHVSITTRLQKV